MPTRSSAIDRLHQACHAADTSSTAMLTLAMACKSFAGFQSAKQQPQQQR